MRNHVNKLALLLVVMAFAVAASTASAQQPGAAGYQTGGENVAGNLQSGGPTDTEVASGVSGSSGSGGGSLPFTGLDIALILGVGGALLAVGLGTRRLTRHADAA
jgi:hypothetical protein